ncbi:MAG: glycine cleavage system protein H [Flavobacteriales bacterium]|nr:glycine cleavage system protein H [Flavobacteriales bacterium]|tara:strand:+ start:5255 stop:5632 length:378 start_codon:yes stop_codon:yes gene_type:complete
MKIEDNLRYTENHEWILIEGNTAIIGITDYAQSELGDIVYVDIDSLGQDLGAGDVFGSVEAVKTVSDLYMPVAGKVVELNEQLESNPDLVNQAPYKEGWIVKIELCDTSDQKLLSPDEYKKHIGL